MRSKLTILTPADSYDLTTLEIVKTELVISGDSYDKKLLGYIHQASGVVASECNRVLAQEEVMEVFRPNGVVRGPLRLVRRPVFEISSVSIDDGDDLDEGEYEVDPTSGILDRLNSGALSLWSAQKSIAVTYMGGYELLEELPYDLARAALLLVKEYWFGGQRDPSMRQQSIRHADVSIEQQWWIATGRESAELSRDVINLIKPYRILDAG